MARLPRPGSDNGSWGDILNDYLSQSLTPTGAIKPDAVSSTQLADNSVTSAQLAPGAVDTAAIASSAVAESQLSASVQSKLNDPANVADNSVTKQKLSTAVQASIDKADSALQSAPVSSVNTRTGAITITKSDVGLTDVNNTSDTDKPVSSATQAALNTKIDSSQKGAASGVAPLDSNSRVPNLNLPTRLQDSALASAFLPQTIVGQSTASLPADWEYCFSTASFLDTPSMGTIKTLGAPSNAWEREYDGLDPVVQDDGTIVCATGAPTPGGSGSTTLTYASGTPSTSGSTWTSISNANGAPDTNRAVFTNATAFGTGYIDLSYSLPTVPSGATINSVAVTPSAFASSDYLMPYTLELVNGSGVHVGSAAQAGNNASTLTFTGIVYSDLAALKVRYKITRPNDTTSGTVSVDAAGVVVNYTQAASTPRYRSEVVFTSDRTDGSNDYTVMRFTEGQRVRVAFDVMTHGLDAQDSGAWNSIFQSLGRATNGSFPYTPLSINVEHGQWIIQGGQAITRDELLPRTTHHDGRWTRWELDILLGRAGTGKVSIWKDGEQLALNWMPTSGTYYAGTGNNAIDLQWVYFKNGLYGAATTSPLTAKAVFRNRRFSVTNGSTTTTWRGPQTSSVGLHLYRRNPVTDMPY